MNRSSPSRTKRQVVTARTADPHDLYERSVQDTSFDIRFLRRVFRKERGREPWALREDFCGTGQLCAHWVRSHPLRTAVGLDLDAATLAWGERRHLAPLGEIGKRAQLLQRNVLDGAGTPVDVTVAFNFSYCIFRQREEMLRYFRRVHGDLGPEGIFCLDIHGGPDAQVETEEVKRLDGFDYVWEQLPMDAVTARAVRHIHFRFRDGTEIKRAFTYDWRIWTLPELRDLLEEAGFARVDVYWEGDDGDGGGNGVFRKVLHAENEASWIAYVVALR